MINLTHALVGFVASTKPVSREVPIFGTLGDHDTLFLGKIDEVNMQDGSNLQIVDYNQITRLFTRYQESFFLIATFSLVSDLDEAPLQIL